MLTGFDLAQHRLLRALRGAVAGGRCLTSRYPQALGKWPTDEPYSVITSKELGLCETMLGKSFHPLTSMNNLAGVLVLSQVRGFPKYTTSNTTMAINFFGFPHRDPA
jgi:hypothetical protein